MSEKRKTIIANIFEYASAQYVSQFVGFFTSTFIRRFLGPVNVGIWSMMKVISNYAGWTTLGTQNAIAYKYPYMMGRGDMGEANNIKNVVFSYIALVSNITFVIIVLVAFFLRSKYPQEVIAGLITVAVLTVTQRIYTYYITLLRADKNFSVLSKSIIFDAIINLVLVVSIVRGFGLYGLYFVLIVMPVLNVIYIKRCSVYNIGFSYRLDKLIEYIKFGFPLFLSSVLNTLLTTVDNIMIAKMIGLKQLGYYSIGTLTRSYSTSLSNNFNIVMIPHFLEEYGETQDIKKVSKYLKIPAIVMSTVMAIILGIGYFALPVFVKIFLPKFTPGILPAQIFLLVTYFDTASPQSGDFLVANNNQSKLLYISGLALFVNVCLNYLAIKNGFGITGVSISTAISSFIVFSITLIYALSHFEAHVKEVILFYFFTLSPLAYSLLIIFILRDFPAVNNIYMSAIAKISIFIVAFLPFLVYINFRTKVFDLVAGHLMRKIKRES